MVINEEFYFMENVVLVKLLKVIWFGVVAGSLGFVFCG